MKVKFIAALIPAMFIASSAYAVEGETSTVSFTGNITEASCALSMDSRNKAVDLGSVTSSAFVAGTGTTTGGKGFSINLTDCAPSVSTATVTFSGDTVNDTALKTSEGDTTNVGIQILQDGAPLKLDGSQASTAQALSEGNNPLNFTARYISLTDTVEAGEANASASFTLNYE